MFLYIQSFAHSRKKTKIVWSQTSPLHYNWACNLSKSHVQSEHSQNIWSLTRTEKQTPWQMKPEKETFNKYSKTDHLKGSNSISIYENYIYSNTQESHQSHCSANCSVTMYSGTKDWKRRKAEKEVTEAIVALFLSFDTVQHIWGKNRDKEVYSFIWIHQVSHDQDPKTRVLQRALYDIEPVCE